MHRLSTTDYKDILEYYNKPVPTSKHELQKQAEKIMSSKLCRCIKKIKSNNESRSIRICSKSIVSKKGYIRGKFTCKKKQSIQLMKKRKTRKFKRRSNH